MSDTWRNMYLDVLDNHPRKPDYTSAMSLLTHLSADELREVLNDERKFEELIKDVKEKLFDDVQLEEYGPNRSFFQLKTVEAEKEILIASNRSLAEFNLSQEPLLLKGRQTILELSGIGEEYSQNIEKKMSEINSRSGGTSLETALALLQTAAAEMEEESDEIANKFLEGDTDVDTFLEQFNSRRKLMHLRKVKTDKLSEMVARRVHPVQTNASFYQAPHPPAPAPSGLPYPVGPVGLPMPGIYSSQSHFG